VADTVQETILARLAVVFEGITTGGGYNNTIHSVKRQSVAGTEFESYPSIAFQAVRETIKARIYPTLDFDMTVECEVWEQMDGSAGTYLDKELAELMGDMQKAVMLDTQLNSLCKYCVPSKREYYRDEVSSCGVGVLTLKIGYTTDADDPTTGK